MHKSLLGFAQSYLAHVLGSVNGLARSGVGTSPIGHVKRRPSSEPCLSGLFDKQKVVSLMGLA